MDHYDPSKNINGKEWLSLDEDHRLNLVEEFHLTLDQEDDGSSITAHCAMHVAVENQLAGDEVPKTNQVLEKLLRQGLDRHEAIHAIAAVLAKELFSLMKANQGEFSVKTYSRKLDRLTAKRWSKGQC